MLKAPYIDLAYIFQNCWDTAMTKHFSIGFCIGLLVFIVVNLIAAHLASDCGLPAVFGRDACFDDFVRAGWPLQFYEEGGFIYRHNLNMFFLWTDMGLCGIFAVLVGLLYSRNKKTLSK